MGGHYSCQSGLTKAVFAIDRLTVAVAGSVARASAARFDVPLAKVYRNDVKWPSKEAKARNAALYLMRTQFDFLTVSDVGRLFDADHRLIARASERIEEARENELWLDAWLMDMEQSLSGAYS